MTADHLLALRHQAGDPHAADQLVRRHDRLCRAIANDFFHPSLERDDLVQHARIGAFNACRDYQAAAGPFRPFLTLCVRREVMTALNTARRGKQQPLNDSIREAVIDDQPLPVLDTITDPNADPADVYVHRQRVRALVAAFSTLTPRERHWLVFAINGGEYHRRATGTKSSENAVDRARRKLREAA